MQIAILADVHGNLPALRAVLGTLDAEPVDAVVAAGDVVAGPLVRDCLDRLDALRLPVHWISGNSERDAVAVFDGLPMPDTAAGRAATWSAGQLNRQWRDRLASWPHALALDGIRFCHGSPRRDDEILTAVSPDRALAEALAGIRESLVIGGHTHRQFIRTLSSRLTYANTGSVGLPFEGRAGAFWLKLVDGVPSLRTTDYDVQAAVQELAASGFRDVNGFLHASLLEPGDPDAMAAFLEQRAGRMC